MTSIECCAYQFDSPYCFSFSMNSVVDCMSICFSLSGYNSYHCDEMAIDKRISHVNFFINDVYPIIYCESGCSFSFIIEERVLLSKSPDTAYVEAGLGSIINFIFKNCILNNNFVNKATAEYMDNKFVEFDAKYIIVFPHYTNEYCDGPDHVSNNESLHGCDVGNCIDNYCNKTIGFPEDVIPYTTIYHLLTPYFTKSSYFSKSSEYSKSSAFSYSLEFSKSEMFSESLKFTYSNIFTFSIGFSKSIEFVNSDVFSLSSFFSNTQVRSKAIYFSKSEIFSDSTLYAPTSIQTSENSGLTFSVTFVETFSNVRTVTFSIAYSLSISKIECTDIQNSISFCDTVIQFQKFLPYIVYSLSPIYVKTVIFKEIKINKNKISQEQLIGIVCGTVSVIFSIIGIILLIVQKRNAYKYKYKFSDISDSSDVNNAETVNNEQIVYFSITNNNIEVDDWL